MDRLDLVAHGYQNGWPCRPPLLYYAKYRCLCTWRWGIEALKSIQGPLQKGNPSLTGRVGSPHTHWFSWRPVENSWSKGLGVLCHQWRQPPREVPKDFCHLILMTNHSLEVLIFLHQPQWKLEFTNPRTVCGPPKELAYFSYGDVRNRLSWSKAKQTWILDISFWTESGHSWQLHARWWKDHRKDAVSLLPAGEKQFCTGSASSLYL